MSNIKDHFKMMLSMASEYNINTTFKLLKIIFNRNILLKMEINSKVIGIMA